MAYGQKEAMEILLKKKCAVDVVDRNGKSIVFIAAEENQFELLKVYTVTGAKEQYIDILFIEHAQWLCC